MAAARTREKIDDGPASPGSDVYTGMLIISLVATLIGIGFLYKDYSEYPDAKPSVKPLQLNAAPVPTPQPPPAPGTQPPAPGKAPAPNTSPPQKAKP